MHTITGTLKDYSGAPLSNGEVILKNDNFEDLVKVMTDSEGRFELKASSGTYNALYAVKDYKTKFLEFWFWDLPLNQDLNLDIKIDGLEVYGIKAWRTYRGAMVFFRPMSLKRFKALGNPDGTKPVLIAPDLKINDITVYLDGAQTKIWGINKVKEKANASKSYMDAYLIHIDDKRELKKDGWQKLCIDLYDSQTEERGQGCASLM